MNHHYASSQLLGLSGHLSNGVSRHMGNFDAGDGYDIPMTPG
jgi:hypothetical protein